MLILILFLQILTDHSFAENSVSEDPKNVSEPPLPTPVDEFRRVLHQSNQIQENYLAKYPEGKRIVLKAKLKEYASFSEIERNARLGALQLRFYLEPLMALPHSERTPALAKVPLEFRKNVEARLQEWDLLPPPLQQEVIESETLRRHFVRIEFASSAARKAILEKMTASERVKVEEGFGHWRGLPASEREKMAARFERFFEMKDTEKEKTLQDFSAEERKGNGKGAADLLKASSGSKTALCCFFPETRFVAAQRTTTVSAQY